jgi:hypothetical protein
VGFSLQTLVFFNLSTRAHGLNMAYFSFCQGQSWSVLFKTQMVSFLEHHVS